MCESEPVHVQFQPSQRMKKTTMRTGGKPESCMPLEGECAQRARHESVRQRDGVYEEPRARVKTWLPLARVVCSVCVCVCVCGCTGGCVWMHWCMGIDKAVDKAWFLCGMLRTIGENTLSVLSVSHTQSQSLSVCLSVCHQSVTLTRARTTSTMASTKIELRSSTGSLRKSIDHPPTPARDCSRVSTMHAPCTSSEGVMRGA
jgi:hypothetical protein